MQLLRISRIPRLKSDYDTSLSERPRNGRKLHDIDNDVTSTHFSRRNVFHALDTRGKILEKRNYAPIKDFQDAET